ncbi:MAG TPA: 3-phosphoshikimate 1-carboxyvinyltransferase [Trueperaceae bacterium]
MQSESDRLEVPPATKPSLDIAVPGSKSLTNRAMVVAALARGSSRLRGALVAEDTAVMKKGLRELGFEIADQGETVVIAGQGGGIPSSGVELDLRLSGTSIRFLTALTALGSGRYRLDGNARMRERPIGDLTEALNALGAKATTASENLCPPVIVEASGLTGGRVTVSGERSSQFLSALLMVAPYAREEVTIEVAGELQSKPFIDLTVGLMADFGIEIERSGYRRFTVPRGVYEARDYRIEGDATAAGYFWAAAAVTGGRVRVTNIGSNARQGDKRLAAILERMGCRVSVDEEWTEVEGPAGGRLAGGVFDLNDIPDQAQTLAVVSLFAASPVEITNVWNLRIKETDRLAALASELRKFGARVEEGEDRITVDPPERPEAATVETYGDHRMAMAFAVAGLRVPGTVIIDPGCVAKTYPGFFDDFLTLSGKGVRS